MPGDKSLKKSDALKKKATAPVKPSFKAPRAKTTIKVAKSPPASVVPCLRQDLSEEQEKSSEANPEIQPMALDPDIYTMELDRYILYIWIGIIENSVLAY